MMKGNAVSEAIFLSQSVSEQISWVQGFLALRKDLSGDLLKAFDESLGQKAIVLSAIHVLLIQIEIMPELKAFIDKF